MTKKIGVKVCPYCCMVKLKRFYYVDEEGKEHWDLYCPTCKRRF